MFLAIVAVIILIMKLAEIGPVANWSWLWVMAPFVLLFLWWEFIADWVGWGRRQAEAKIKAAEAEAKADKKKNRGF